VEGFRGAVEGPGGFDMEAEIVDDAGVVLDGEDLAGLADEDRRGAVANALGGALRMVPLRNSFLRPFRHGAMSPNPINRTFRENHKTCRLFEKAFSQRNRISQ